jgi:hypothetical protein
MNYYQIPNDPRNTLLNLLKNQKVKNEEKDEKEKKSFFERELYVGPLEKARRQRQAGQIVDPVNEQPEIQKPAIPVIATSNQNQSGGLLSEKDEKEVEERLNKDIETKAKYTKAGDFFARVGGFNAPSPTQEQIEQATPEQLDYFNKQRLAARNKGIGEMLLMLSDALGGKDVAMRALERKQARQPKEKSVSEIRSSILSKLMIPGGKISRTEFNTLVGIDPNYRDLAITNPELFDFTDDESGVPQGFSGTPDQWNLLKESNPDKPDEDLIKYFNENYGV